MTKKITDAGVGNQIDNVRAHSKAFDAAVHGISMNQTRKMGGSDNASTGGDVAFVRAGKPTMAP